ncbi:hypothetical protein KJ786_00680 [Patescibacteria group bacterium]|nr:hypothetical protein [Patescibacteria group bacterium]
MSLLDRTNFSPPGRPSGPPRSSIQLSKSYQSSFRKINAKISKNISNQNDKPLLNTYPSPKTKPLFNPNLQKNNNQSGGGLFKGKSGICRGDLREALRKDPKVFKAQRETGLNLSRGERVKLEKKVFSPILGRNISKTDLKQSISKLCRELVASKNPGQKKQLRKEIKFFKRIGGIK